MDAKAKEYGLNSLEKVKCIYLTAEPFSVENDIITPTFKIKRNIAKKVFLQQIEKMYAESNI
jgi:long-chain acyl-CoA synthetase